MNEECLICKAPLAYLEADMLMECEICHKKENSKTRCVNGHYVCNECHTQGLDRIIELCMTSASRDPISIIEQMMALPTCHMHGPEHHVMVGAALLTAYRNAGGNIDLRSALTEMMNRGRSVPGGACGFWGACGAGISTGMFVSIISQSTPLTNEPFALSHKMTAKSEVHAAASEIPSSPSLLSSTLQGSSSALRWKSRRSYAITPRKIISASENAVRFLR